MTQKDFLSGLAMLAKVCEFQMTQELVCLYDRALRKFGYDKAIQAIEDSVIERRGNDRMPSIGDLAHRCEPKAIDADTAVEVSARILSAISKFGYANRTEAEVFIGSIGKYVVDLNGGWMNLCTVIQEKDLTTWRAQLREQAAGAIRADKAGRLGKAPEFPMDKKIASLMNEGQNDSRRNTRPISPEPSIRQLNAENPVGISQIIQGNLRRQDHTA